MDLVQGVQLNYVNIIPLAIGLQYHFQQRSCIIYWEEKQKFQSIRFLSNDDWMFLAFFNAWFLWLYICKHCKIFQNQYIKQKSNLKWDCFSFSCGDRIRTDDLQVMSLASYHCSTPRSCECKSIEIIITFQIKMGK